jgi:hypothetical protein
VRVRLLPVLAFLAIPAAAQVPRASTPAVGSGLQVPQPLLRRMIRDSARIFAGTVTSVQGVQTGPGIPITRVTFRVDEAVRGVRKGETIEIREWGGLWLAGERYRAGERVLLFLHPESRLGLTSPTAGAMGRWSIQRDGKVEPRSTDVRLRKADLKVVAAMLRRAARE